MKRFLFGGLALVLFIVLGVAAFLYGSVFEPLRQSVIASITSSALDRDVVIEGTATLDVGTQLRISAGNVKLESSRAGTTEDSWHTLGSVDLTIPVASLLSGTPEVSSVSMSEVVVYLGNEATESEAGAAQWSGDDLAHLPHDFLSLPISHAFELNNAKFLYPEDANGWEFDLSIDHLTSQQSDDGKRIAINAKATFNGAPISTEGDFADPTHAEMQGLQPFTFSWSALGLTTEHSGTMDTSQPIARVVADQKITATSLAEVQTLLGLQAVVDGQAELFSHIEGPLDATAATEVALNVEFSSGGQFKVSGSVEDLSVGTGVDLDFTAVLARNNETPTEAQNPLQLFALNGFKGTLQGDYGSLFVRNFLAETNVAEGELKEIGPISIERFTKDENGRLGLIGIKILNGDLSNPSFDLEGDVSNALQLSGIDLKGRINLAISELLVQADLSDPKKLGRLKGSASVSDASGALRLESLTAELSETELWTLAVTTEGAQADTQDGQFLVIDLDIPKFEDWAAQLGAKFRKIDHVGFSGRIGYAGSDVILDGTAIFGKTKLVVDTTTVIEKGAPRVTGSIQSDLLRLIDMRNALDVFSTDDLRPRDMNISMDENLIAETQVDLAISVKKIAGSGKAISGLKTNILSSKGQVTADPLSVQYLGGQIQAAVNLDTTATPVGVALSGRIDKLKMGTILAELGMSKIVTGTLNLSFDLSGRGETAGVFVRSMSGKMAGSIWGGEVGTRLIDLAGQSVVRWMFSGGQKGEGARLVCAVGPIRFKNGSGTVGPVVIETDNVQIVGSGSLNLKNETIDITFTPRAKKAEIVPIATKFAVKGSLSKPQVETLSGGGAGRAVAEVVSTPLNLLGALFSGPADSEAPAGKKKNKPCVVPKNTGAK